MLAILDAIRIDNNKRRDQDRYRKCCQGSTVKGHYRDGIWIAEHEQEAHVRTYKRK